MTPLISIISYNRPKLLGDLLESLRGCTTKIVVFWDGPFAENFQIPTWNNSSIKLFSNYHAGVAGNSNRALKYFLERHQFDVLFLLNDDLIINDLKVFQAYLNAIEKTGYQFFCYTDEHSLYKPSAEFTKKGVTLVRRKTGDGCFQVMTRDVVQTLGGYDVEFGMFGGEDIDYARRAAAVGFSLDNLDVKEAQGLITPRQYYERIPRALGEDTTKHLLEGSRVWLEKIQQDPVIWKKILC